MNFRIMNHGELVKNIHRLGLENPPDSLGNDFTTVKGEYQYYHYLCDNYDDRGWGCGYRTLQEMVYLGELRNDAKETTLPNEIPERHIAHLVFSFRVRL